MSLDRLPDELRVLGASVQARVSADHIADAVLSRLDEQAPRSPAAVRRRLRRRLVVVIAVAAFVALVLTPPVRAAVADFFGIVVTSGQEVEAEPVETVHSDLTVARAAEIVDFEPVVPAQLGEPAGVEVSDDRRVLSMSWSPAGGTVRLDEFKGEVAPAFVKRSNDVEFVMLDGGNAIWFATPHEVLPLGENGEELVELTRSAAPTLVWSVGDVTLRLEGLAKTEAAELAEDVLRNP